MGHSTRRPPWGLMSFASMTASSRIDRRDDNLPKTITFGLYEKLTFPYNGPYDIYINVKKYTKVHKIQLTY